MKKIIKAITLFLLIAIFGEVSYAAEYLNSVEFTEKYMNNDVMWSGREWITDTYPPKISQDATEFMSVEENEDVKEELKNYCIIMCGRETIIWYIKAILIIGNIICKSICTDFQLIFNKY